MKSLAVEASEVMSNEAPEIRSTLLEGGFGGSRIDWRGPGGSRIQLGAVRVDQVVGKSHSKQYERSSFNSWLVPR